MNPTPAEILEKLGLRASGGDVFSHTYECGEHCVCCGRSCGVVDGQLVDVVWFTLEIHVGAPVGFEGHFVLHRCPA